MGRVLIVDDLAMVRASLRCLLQECAPFAIGEVSSVEGACQWLEKFRTEAVDAIFCDWRLGDGTILDLMAFIKAEGLSVPVYWLAPDGDNSLIRAAMDMGAKEGLLKPLNRTQLWGLKSFLPAKAA